MLYVSLQLQSQEPAFLPNLQIQVNFSTTLVQRGKTLIGWRRGCGLAGLGNLQAAAEAPSYAEWSPTTEAYKKAGRQQYGLVDVTNLMRISCLMLRRLLRRT